MTAPVATGTRPTRVRYQVIALIFLITSINYADRATFAIAGNAASGELGLSPIQTGFILSAFAWSYVLAQIPGACCSIGSAPSASMPEQSLSGRSLQLCRGRSA
ncbi:hypothetical protein ACFSUK_07460 [Sphingobium scionense]